MHISKGEFLALVFVLWENHARRTRKVQIIKMQKVERLDPGLNLPVLMPFNPLKVWMILVENFLSVMGSLKGMLFVLHPLILCPRTKSGFIHKFNVVSKHNSPLNQSTGLLLSIPMDSEREETGLSSSSFLLFFFKYFLYFG